MKSQKAANHQETLDRSFVDAANPHAWFMSASNLHEQAIYLRKNSGKSILWMTDGSSRVLGSWDMTNKSVYLLSGLVVENLIKAFLVFENPHWISNGHLARNLRTHNLVDLEDRSTIVPLKGKYDWALRDLGDGIDSWARYPCSLSAETLRIEAVMTPKLWNTYKILVRRYSSELIAKLSEKLWRGPHGFEGRWTFQGHFFEL
jgi:hypothetical protein